MKISIDTDVDTVDNALRAVRAACGQAFPATGSADDDDDGYILGNWTRPRLRKLVEWLGDSDAATTVRYLAEQAPSVSLDDTYQHMSEHTGIDGRHMGGRMYAVASPATRSVAASDPSTTTTATRASTAWRRKAALDEPKDRRP